MIIGFEDLPSPRGLPLVGNLHQVKLSQLHNWFEEQATIHGDIFKVKLGPLDITVVADPDLIQEILKSRPDGFRRGSKLDRVMQEENIHGVFNAEGEAWKLHRRIVTRGLDIKHQEAFYPSMTHIAARLHRKMIQAAMLGSSYKVRDDLMRFTVDVTTSLAFGIDMNTLEQEGHVIQDHMEKIFPTIFQRINSPVPWYKWWSTKKDKAFRNALNEIQSHVQEFIRTGYQRLNTNPELVERPENILDALLVAAREESAVGAKEIQSNLLTLLMAGEDTTAHSLAWAIYLVAQQPEIQLLLQAEADHVLGEEKWLSNYSRHSMLTYTTAVIQETLRLKSVAPVMIVEPLEDSVLKQYRFRKGARMVLLTRFAGLQEANFTKAREMHPERWLEQNNNKCPVHHISAYMPFGFGPRQCPGKNLAMLEMKLVLSMIAKNFHVQLFTPPEEVREQMAFTMMPDSYAIKLHKRE